MKPFSFKNFGMTCEGTAVSLFSTTASLESPEISNSFFGLPLGDGRMYILSSDFASAGHTLADNMSINPSDVGKYFERWLSLRGSE